MVLDESRVPADRVGDDTGVALRGPPDHLPEHRAVHGRLVLEQAVKQPDARQGQLEHPARVRTGRGSGADAFPPSPSVSPEGELNQGRALLPHCPYFAKFRISTVPSPESVT